MNTRSTGKTPLVQVRCNLTVCLLLSLLIVLLPQSLGFAQTVHHVPQVYLIQNSGWMEPFFTDPKSQFQPLVRALVEKTALAGQQIVIASFNQAGVVPGEASPKIIYRDAGIPSNLASVLASITLPRRSNRAFADADYGGALRGTLLEILNRQPAVIWMVTNNKNDPGNSPDVIRHTQEFYSILREQPGITRVIAYPVAMPVKSRYFQEMGLMIYSIAFGEQGSQTLQQLLASGSLATLFTLPPAKLKPLDEEAVSFSPASVLTPDVEARLANGRLVVTLAAQQHERVAIRGQLRNDYYPYEIRHARVMAAWVKADGAAQSLPVEVQPAVLANLGPNAAVDVVLTIPMPPPPSLWNTQALLQEGYQIPGSLRVTLSDLQLRLSPVFEQKMDAIYGLNKLPEIFRPAAALTESTTDLPFVAVGLYPAWPLFAAGAVVLLLIILIMLSLILLWRERRYTVEIDGSRSNVALRPFARRAIFDAEGQPVAQLHGSLFGKPQVRLLNTDKKIRIQ